MIARSTLSRAALTSAVLIFVLAIPTAWAWWTASQEAADRTTVEVEHARMVQTQPSISAAPPVVKTSVAAKPAQKNGRLRAIAAPAALQKPDYGKFVVRLEKLQPPEEQACEQ